MSDIPNTEYVTVKADGIFVGGKPATHYRGMKIEWSEHIKKIFQDIQEKYPNIQEMRFLTSTTTGEFHATGNPVPGNGSNAWACVLFNDGYVSPWVIISRIYSYDYFIRYEIGRKLSLMTENYCFLEPLLGDYKDVVIRLNLQNMAGKQFELNGYKITIEKIAQEQKQR